MLYTYHALVVMYDTNNLELLAKRLEDAGFKVDTCKNEEEAKQAIDINHYQILLLQDSIGKSIIDYFCLRYDYLHYQAVDTLEERMHPRFLTCIIIADLDMPISEVNDSYRDYRRIAAVNPLRWEKSLNSNLKYEILPYLQRARITIDHEKQIFLKFLTNFDDNNLLDSHKIVRKSIQHLVDNDHEHPEKIETSLVNEYVDLVNRLLPNYQRADIVPLKGGFSGGSVLLVRPFVENDLESEDERNMLVLKIDNYSVSHREYTNYQNYIQDTIPYNRLALARDYYRTTRLGGILYSFVGTDDGIPLRTLEDVYLETTDQNFINHILDVLLNTTCKRWYARRSPRKYDVDLAEHYREHLKIRQEKLATRLATLPEIDINILPSQFNQSLALDPVSFAFDLELQRGMYRSISHGDMNARNILLNQSGDSWLIDFQFSGRHHVMQDIASLDTALRIHLLQGESVSLEKRILLEYTLLDATSLSELASPKDKLSFDQPDLEKAYYSVLHLRQLAIEKLLEYTDDSDLLEYLVPLFFYTLRSIQFLNLEEIQRQQARISASLLAQRITELMETDKI